MTGKERGAWITDTGGRHDLAVFAERARVLDDAAVIRLRTRSDGLVGAWVATGFGVLAGRAVAGRINPGDLTCAADALARALRTEDPTGYANPGYPLDSAWRGALPPENGFVHLDDVPAAVLADLARQGADAAREAGGHGPPASLLDQEVLEVSGDHDVVGVPMRCVLALTAMRFIPDEPDDAEVVRVRAAPTWLRLDARFGTVVWPRAATALLVR